MRRTVALLAVLALLLTLSPAPAPAQFVVLDPANLYQQILQYAQMILDYYQQYEQLVNEIEQLVRLIEQIELMLENLEQVEDLRLDNPGRILHDLRAILDQLGGVVYSADDLLRTYDHLYSPDVAHDLPAQERERTEKTLQTMRTLLAASRQSARDTEDSAHALASLSNQLEAAEGNLEALQAVGAINTQLATETARLNETTAATLNALAVSTSHELASREQARRTLLDWIARGSTSDAGPEHETFSPVPPAFLER